VTAWGPEVQRGKRKYSDERFVASVREQIEKAEKAVSDKQLEALAKMAIRYRGQIPDADAELGALGFSELIATENAAPSSEETQRRFDVLKSVKLSETQAAFVGSLQQQAESGRRLSPKQLAALDRIIGQNSAQIENFDEIKQTLQLALTETDQQPDSESPVLMEMMRNVTQWQEPVKRGKMTFDDKAFFASLSDQFDRKKSLSPRQRYAMKRMTFRYKAQIPEFDRYAEQLGLNKKGKAGKEEPKEE